MRNAESRNPTGDHPNTGEPGAVISRMPGSVGGRRKRVRTRGYLAGDLPCLRRLTRRWITLAESRGSEGDSLWVTHLTWTRKREGTTAWWESVERCEGVDGTPTQDPCDMAKTRLFEAQFPVMEMRILRHTTPRAEPPASGESPLLRPNPSGWWAVSNELTQGNGKAAYVTLDTSSARGIRDHLRGESPTVTECQ